MDSGVNQTMQYPRSLMKVFDCVGDEIDLHKNKHPDGSSTLFTEGKTVSVDVVRFSRDGLPTEGTKHSTITSSEDFDPHLSPPNDDIGHLLFIIKPSKPNCVSECKLNISEEMAKKLQATYGIFPVFYSFLHAFGSAPDITFGGCKHKFCFSTLQQSPAVWDLSKPPFGFEICYNFKSAVPRTGRLPPHNWSIRQTAVYQKFTYEKRQNVWILVQPEVSVRKQVEQSFESHGRHFPEKSYWNPLELHLLFTSAAAENWGAYFNDLEKEFVSYTTDAVEIRVGSNDNQSSIAGDTGDPRDHFVVEFRSIQILQRFEERIQLFKSSLEINEDTIRSLQTMNTNLRDFGSDPTSKLTWHCVDAALEQQLADISRHKRNIDDLLRKIQGRGRLLYNVLEYQTQFQLTKLAAEQEEERYIKRIERKKTFAMNEKTVRDTVGVKIMTVVAMVYLPSTFVATFLAAGIISISKDNIASTSRVNFRRVQFSCESLIFFFSISVPLTILTVGTWYCLEKRNRNRKVIDDEENTSPPKSP